MSRSAFHERSKKTIKKKLISPTFNWQHCSNIVCIRSQHFLAYLLQPPNTLKESAINILITWNNFNLLE